jgi:hypothetical protein
MCFHGFLLNGPEILTTEAIGPIFNCEVKLANGYTSTTVFLFYKQRGKNGPFGEVRQTLNSVPVLSVFSPTH